ncbi:MAG: hypothetical protein Q6373_009445 [Candidatus Sigynarchaeota archaeon]
MAKKAVKWTTGLVGFVDDWKIRALDSTSKHFLETPSKRGKFHVVLAG